ncbi:heparinase II/III family protein [Paenibacillus sp. GCM10012303]|uniref:heparinase II/III domain-containing protein n=1 Tax=Paenibacillus sp. GCM10012303 TaxID=3317340 RepID=UPI003610DE39
MKRRSTIYTLPKRENARRNAERFEWAKALRDRAVNEADSYLAIGHEALWNLVPGQTLPRSYGVNQRLGSPVTGKEIDKYGNYPYQADPLKAPWKITDPSSGMSFPTNDFAAYYASGLDESGFFRPERADRSLLVNTLYPGRGPDWGVDDGYGWTDEKGNTYTFVAYYVHWFLWHPGTGAILKALAALRDAYLYTGRPEYAAAGIVLLHRVADVYPSLDVAEHDKTIFLNSHGGTGLGQALGSIWEASLVKQLLYCYDAFFPAMGEPEAIRFLNGKSPALSGTGHTAETLCSHIEQGIVRQVYPAVKAARNYGNTGFHQSALALAAVVLDQEPETGEWIAFNGRAGKRLNQPWQVTGGNILSALVNDVDRDGHGNEASPGYNALWLNSLLEVADIMEGYSDDPAADLYRHPKFRKMFDAFIPLICSGRFVPTIGDTGKAGNPGIGFKGSVFVKAFEVYGDPVFAQAAYLINGNGTAGITGGMFSDDPERIARDIEDVVANRGRLRLDSDQFTGYGFSVLREGEEGEEGGADGSVADTRRDVWMYYGRNTGHGHRDTLNIGIHAFGIDLTPDLGYPEFADTVDMHRAQWVIGTTSHNTVLVDKKKQDPQWVGEPRHFDDAGRIKLMDVEAPQAYRHISMYKRVTAMVRVGRESFYAVDLFRVQGGQDHHYSFHGAEGPVTVEGLSLVPQKEGTYAGADSSFGVRPEGDDVPGAAYNGAGFHWLNNVERDRNPQRQFSVDWSVVDTWGSLPEGERGTVHIRLTMLGEFDEVALADGVPPRNKPGNPASLRYVLAHRQGGDLSSFFTSVLEPYQGERVVRAIRLATVERKNAGSEAAGIGAGAEAGAKGAAAGDLAARAVRVELACGRTDYIVSSLDPAEELLLDGEIVFRGAFGLYSERAGSPEYAYVHDGTEIGRVDSAERLVLAAGRRTGKVTGFTKELRDRNTITVQLEGTAEAEELQTLAGRFVYVANDGVRNAVYRIRSAYAGPGGGTVLDIGDMTLIRSYADPEDYAKGFVYDIKEGAALYIPLSAEREYSRD